MNPSSFQQAIYEEIKSGTSNLLIEAVAGSGKTTTIIEASKLVPADKNSLFLAFNKNIASELSVRLPPNIKARTFHALGYAFCMKQGWFKTNDNKVKNIYYYKIHNYDTCTALEKRTLNIYAPVVCDYVNLLRATGITDVGNLEHAIQEIGSHYDLDTPDRDLLSDIIKTFKQTLTYTNVLDFEDMIYRPATLPWKLDQYDYIFVDEAQDLSYSQALFLKKLLSPKGKIIFVGDSSQAIYGFRGASVDSLDQLAHIFSCKRLPLSICYRCGIEIVKEARKICDQIQPFEQSLPGIVRSNENALEELQGGDLVLARTLLPLQQTLTYLVKHKIPLWFDYPELIADLVKHSENVTQKYTSLTPLNVDGYSSDKVEELLRYNQLYRAEQLKSKLELLREITTLFPGEERLLHVLGTVLGSRCGVRLMSIHKGKGLEENRVFILNPSQLPHPRAKFPWQIKQEYNLKYVAITRAKKELVYAEIQSE